MYDERKTKDRTSDSIAAGQNFFKEVFDLTSAKNVEVKSDADRNSIFSIEDAMYMSLCFTAGKNIKFATGNLIKFKYKNHTVTASIGDTTTFSPADFLRGERVYMILRMEECKCTVKVVFDKENYDIFSNFGTVEEKYEAFIRYCLLSDKDKEEIRRYISSAIYPVGKSVSGSTSSIEELKFRFNLCRGAYTPQQQMDIECIFNECKSGTLSNKIRAERRVRYILNIAQTVAPEVTMTKEEIIAKLDKYLYKLDNVKVKIAEAIVAAKVTKKKGFSILLIGSPGVGKTAIINAVGKVLGRPTFVIPLGSTSSIIDVVGDAPQYDASDSGEVVKNFYKAGTTCVVMGLDEYDKSYESTKEGSKVSKAFNDALSDERFFKDAFLGTYINTSNTVFIATANSTDTIPENLLNRFTVIRIDDYTDEEKVEIAKRCILPSLLKEYGIKRSELTVTDVTINYIVRNFCEDEGARDLKKHLESIICRVVSEWDSNGKKKAVRVTKKLVDEVLVSYVDAENPAIIYRRNKRYYSPQVSSEITELISKLRRDDLEAQNRDKCEKRLDYLVHMIPVGNAFADFDKAEYFRTVDKTHYGLENVKRETAQIFNISAINGKSLTSNRLLLVGPPGIGKTSIVKSIAAGCGSKYVKISLNGVSDEAFIKGHSHSYASADAGQVVKAIRKMGTSKGIIQLDEIDKMGCKEGMKAANSLVDLLDDSAEFTDNFLGVPIDLTGIMFIATANDISAIDSVLLDRFTVIRLDGYTEKEKAAIVSDYIVPAVIAELCPRNFELSFTDDAKRLVSSVYCRSFGVRDADKAARRIVKQKLYEVDIASGKAKITSDDVARILGTPPAERGNFPAESYAGLSKALAVTGDNCGMAFAVETKLIPDDNSLTVTGLPMDSTLDSVKLASTYIKCRYPGVLKNKGVHVHFGEGSVRKDGPSAGVAILISMLSAVLETPVSGNVAYTGEINANGYVFNIGGTVAKIQAAEQSGCTKVFIPMGNYRELSAKGLEQFRIEVVPVIHVSEVIEAVLPDAFCNTKVS